MVGYGGSFLKGLAGGLQTGINMGTQLQEMRWQKKQRKQLEETQTRMLEAGNLWNAKIKEISADNIITDEEMAQLSTVFLSGGYEFMEHYGSAMNYITGMKDKEYKQELEWINLYIDGIAGLSPGDIQAAYDFIEPKITSEKGLNMLEAYTNMQKRKQEAMQAQPTAEVFTTLEAARAKYPEAKIEFNAQAGGYVVEAGEVKPPAAPPTELDIMGETQKKLDYAYNTGNANYFNQIAKSLGVDTTFDTYKQAYKKPEAVGAAKTKAVDPNDILFGTNGIMKNYINSGSQLGEEQKTEIRNNYNLIKPSLSADVRTQVEDYLKQIGIDVNAEIPKTPIITEEEEPPPNIFQKGITAVKNWLNRKGTPQQIDYINMPEDILFKLAEEGDQLAYEEAKRRGLIK